MADAPKPKKRKQVGGKRRVELESVEDAPDVSDEDLREWRASQGRPLKEKSPKMPREGR
jgi:hypothetical protein